MIYSYSYKNGMNSGSSFTWIRRAKKTVVWFLSDYFSWWGTVDLQYMMLPLLSLSNEAWLYYKRRSHTGLL